MGASRTQGSTIPAELLRQSQRIGEQYTQLDKIITTISDDLEEMSTMMGDYSEELKEQFNQLRDYLGTYKTKSSEIYDDVAKSLEAYATKLMYNLENLTNQVSGIGSAIQNLVQ